MLKRKPFSASNTYPPQILTALVVIISPSLRRTRVINTPTSYSGGFELEFQSWDIVPCQMFVVSFSNSKEMPVYYFEIG
jgi:hypothetical protein